MNGLTEAALSRMDDLIHIPMRGFTESFNISVSVALCLYELTNKLYTSGINWKLSDVQTDELRLEWYKKVVKRSGMLEKEFFEMHN
jgi:tRNA (guanosine-2'-O-)-methyltransferase